MLSQDTKLKDLKDLNKKNIFILEELNIFTIKDLIYYFPSKYEEYTPNVSIKDFIEGENIKINGTLTKVNIRRSFKRNLHIINADFFDGEDSIRVSWFNAQFLAYKIKEGIEVTLQGKVSFKDNEFTLINPSVKIIQEDKKEIKYNKKTIIPIYKDHRKIPSITINKLINNLLNLVDLEDDIIPDNILNKLNFPSIKNSIINLHFPKSFEDINKAQKRINFDQILFLELINQKTRGNLAKEKAQPILHSKEEYQSLIDSLKFTLTKGQKDCLKEVLDDLEKSHPMNRLVQGDVGSGKTVIAAFSCIITARRNLLSAFASPTEILATQHYKNITQDFKEVLKKWRIGVGLVTGSECRIHLDNNLESKITKASLIKSIEKKEVKILIGTHALFSSSLELKDLSLAVIDEQHRFGVKQRNSLSKHRENIYPHFLSMTATPIPRTLALSLFSDLDLSSITELPKNRLPIITKIVEENNRSKAYKFIDLQIQKGHQIFILCPKVFKNKDTLQSKEDYSTLQNKEEIYYKEEKNSLKEEIKSVEEEYIKIKRIFPKYSISFIHGKMKKEEKDSVMKNFKENKSQILISTSVIEVGIDIPNATVMIIESAERFGLTQLHQFRGRVGRSIHQSYCFLFTNSQTETTLERLQSFIIAKNCFELAEMDLKQRGPGELLGTSQKGVPDSLMKSILNPLLIQVAKKAATYLLEKSEDLSLYPKLKKALEPFEKTLHPE